MNLQVASGDALPCHSLTWNEGCESCRQLIHPGPLNLAVRILLESMWIAWADTAGGIFPSSIQPKNFRLGSVSSPNGRPFEPLRPKLCRSLRGWQQLR